VTLAGFAVFMSYGADDDDCDAVCAGSFLLILGGRIWGIGAAVDAAYDYNESLLGPARIGLMPRERRLSVGLGFRF
jgi:hypothetical protein